MTLKMKLHHERITCYIVQINLERGSKEIISDIRRNKSFLCDKIINVLVKIIIKKEI